MSQELGTSTPRLVDSTRDLSNNGKFINDVMQVGTRGGGDV